MTIELFLADEAATTRLGQALAVLLKPGDAICLCGPLGAGKSRLLTRLTRATPEVAPYPFTTREPHAGMMEWEDVRVQLIDTPPVTPDYLEGWQTSMVRSADACVLVVDLADDGGDLIGRRLGARFGE